MSPLYKTKPASKRLIKLIHTLLSSSVTEELKGEKDAGKEVKPAKEEALKGNGRPTIERPRFMFNIADGGFTGKLQLCLILGRHPGPPVLLIYRLFSEAELT